MNTMIKKIGTRELLRNIKSIKVAVKAGQEFEVYDRTTPLFRIVPSSSDDTKRYAFTDLSQFRFAASPDMATNIDRLVYGDS